MDAILKKLNELNPGRNILSVNDDSFKRFGTIHKSFKVDSLLKYLDQNNNVSDEVVYIPDVVELRKDFASEINPIIQEIYAGMDVQVGRCLARNNTLNALEFHFGSEVYITATDMIMLLGLDEDISWPEGTYDTSKIKAFYAPRGSVIELKGGCLHFVGINVYHEQGINLIVTLLKDTNSKIDLKVEKQGKNKLLIAKNTWFLAHPESKQFKEAGFHLGLTGENMSFKTL